MMIANKIKSTVAGVCAIAFLAACDPSALGGKITDPEKFPDEIASSMVNLYLASWTPDKCPSFVIDDKGWNIATNRLIALAAVNNVDEDKLVEHFKGDKNTKKEDHYFYEFYERHNFSYDDSKFDKEFCAAMVKEDSANTAIGRLIKRK